jgi:hypothetical protein
VIFSLIGKATIRTAIRLPNRVFATDFDLTVERQTIGFLRIDGVGIKWMFASG